MVRPALTRTPRMFLIVLETTTRMMIAKVIRMEVVGLLEDDKALNSLYSEGGASNLKVR